MAVESLVARWAKQDFRNFFISKITLRVRFELTRCDAPLVVLSRDLSGPQDQRRRPLGYLSSLCMFIQGLLSLTIINALVSFARLTEKKPLENFA
jgi:hypothetical protein